MNRAFQKLALIGFMLLPALVALRPLRASSSCGPYACVQFYSSSGYGFPISVQANLGYPNGTNEPSACDHRAGTVSATLNGQDIIGNPNNPPVIMVSPGDTVSVNIYFVQYFDCWVCSLGSFLNCPTPDIYATSVQCVFTGISAYDACPPHARLFDLVGTMTDSESAGQTQTGQHPCTATHRGSNHSGNPPLCLAFQPGGCYNLPAADFITLTPNIPNNNSNCNSCFGKTSNTVTLTAP